MSPCELSAEAGNEEAPGKKIGGFISTLKIPRGQVLWEQCVCVGGRVRGPFSFLPQPAPRQAPGWSSSKELAPVEIFSSPIPHASDNTPPAHPMEATPGYQDCPALLHVLLWQSCGCGRPVGGYYFYCIRKETEAQRGEVTGPWSRRDRIRIQSFVLCGSPWSRLVLGCLLYLRHGPGLPTEPGVPRRRYGVDGREDDLKCQGRRQWIRGPPSLGSALPRCRPGAAAWADACGDRRTPLWWQLWAAAVMLLALF